MGNYSLQDIKSGYQQKKIWERQFPLNYFLVRPISFYITYFVIRITPNPARIAAFGFVLGVLGCFSLTLITIWTIWPGLFLILLYSFLDAVDGNVARTTQNVTLFGKYLDGFLGDLIDGAYPFCLGIGLYLSGHTLQHNHLLNLPSVHTTVLPLFLGALILICKLWAKLFQAGYEAYRVQKQGQNPIGESKLKQPTGKSRHSDRWYYLIFINIDSLNTQLLSLIILVLFEAEILFLMFMSLYFCSKAIFYLLYYFIKTKKLLQN